MNAPKDRCAISIGIPKPETEPKSVDEMRVAIRNASYNCALIHGCLTGSTILGRSGEDTYAHLAYHALRLLQDYSTIIHKFTAASPVSLVKELTKVDTP